ncbi:CBS domain-containing protein [Kitasatospora terrestris]|uniref:CBS domain-containing protein n=1 Tax=Kitasatospora terrestris TaxID=258051 RepID=A0ABP9D8Z3_9ACTN
MEHSWDTVGEVMTHAVVAVGRDAPYREIAETLRSWKVGSVPVLTGDGRVIGVVSEADLLVARESEGEDGAEAMTAGQLMSAPAATVHPGSPAAEAARTLARRGLRRLPVVDEEDYLLGIVSRGDLLKIHLREDEDLAAQVRFELLAALHPGPAGELDVRAEDGRVTVTGPLPDALTPAGLARLIRSVPGVVDAAVRAAAPA